MHVFAESVEIQTGLGASFHVSAETFWRAQQAANLTALIHYLGVLPNNGEVMGTDSDVLRELGCTTVVPVFPERRSPMQQFGDFVMHGGAR